MQLLMLSFSSSHRLTSASTIANKLAGLVAALLTCVASVMRNTENYSMLRNLTIVTLLFLISCNAYSKCRYPIQKDGKITPSENQLIFLIDTSAEGYRDYTGEVFQSTEVA